MAALCQGAGAQTPLILRLRMILRELSKEILHYCESYSSPYSIVAEQRFPYTSCRLFCPFNLKHCHGEKSKLNLRARFPDISRLARRFLFTKLFGFCGAKERSLNIKRVKRNQRNNSSPMDDDTTRPKLKASVDKNSPVIKAFLGYQEELDMRYDKYERLVKLSRDITIECKRVIFSLHRSSEILGSDTLLEQAVGKLEEIKKKKFSLIAKELEGEDPYQFIRAYTIGLQEYIEALSFYCYIKEGRLISLSETVDSLTFPRLCPESSGDVTTKLEDQESNCNQLYVMVRPLDFLLGIADLTGELMRLAIKCVSGDDTSKTFKICCFIRIIHDAFLSFGNMSKDISAKVWMIKQSLRKVETACYMLQVRGTEIAKHMLGDVLCSVISTTMDCDDDSYSGS